MNNTVSTQLEHLFYISPFCLSADFRYPLSFYIGFALEIYRLTRTLLDTLPVSCLPGDRKLFLEELARVTNNALISDMVIRTCSPSSWFDILAGSRSSWFDI